MELDLVHEELISEENVNVNDLPNTIKSKIKGFNLMYGKLKNNPENEALKNTVQRTSISIADEIQNWLETDFEEEEEEEDDNNGNNNPAPASVSAPKGDNTPPASKGDNTPPAQKSNNEPKRFGNLVMEKKILSILNSNGGRIDSKTLTSIILKEPNYPTQVVHNIVLKKVFLSSAYKLA